MVVVSAERINVKIRYSLAFLLFFYTYNCRLLGLKGTLNKLPSTET